MKPIEIKLSVDTTPIDSLITKLERAVELQKQLIPNHKPTLLGPISVEPAMFGVVVGWSEWPHGAVRVYGSYRRGNELIEVVSQPISNSWQCYLINGLMAGEWIDCHVRFYDHQVKEILRSVVVTGQASADASEIINAIHTGGYLSNKQTYNIRMGTHINECVFSGTMACSTVKPQADTIKQLQKDVANIIKNATDNQHQIERVNFQREKDFIVLSKALRSAEQHIEELQRSHRDSFIR
ncbi:hypothetical protein [Yersinia alsatica]|uniref:hypothetical protein n=1 Tax=Yersinia alsatica TaxID=2890317 RepID=UPI00119F63B9|nr:hypothetical protein [Yersinia alsatica]